MGHISGIFVPKGTNLLLFQYAKLVLYYYLVSILCVEVFCFFMWECVNFCDFEIGFGICFGILSVPHENSKFFSHLSICSHKWGISDDWLLMEDYWLLVADYWWKMTDYWWFYCVGRSVFCLKMAYLFWTDNLPFTITWTLKNWKLILNW